MQDNSNKLPVDTYTLTRFFSKIRIDPAISFNGVPCWTWTAYIDPHGYARFTYDGVQRPAHRMAYGMFVHIVPSNHHADHLCRRPNCVNPVHVDDVPPRINTLRGIGPSAKNAKKTICDRGHEFTPENTIHYMNKGMPARACRECKRRLGRERTKRGSRYKKATPEQQAKRTIYARAYRQRLRDGLHSSE